MKRHKISATLLFSFLLSFGGFLLLTACNKNPILQVDPNIFAKAVDTYCSGSTGWDYKPAMHECAGFYYDPAKASKFMSALSAQEELKKLTEKECPQEFKRLAEYLNKDPKFSGVTAENLASQEVWRLYFNGKHKMSKYFGE